MVDRLLPNSPTCLPATHLLPHKSGGEWGGAFCCTQTQLNQTFYQTLLFLLLIHLKLLLLLLLILLLLIPILPLPNLPISHEQIEVASKEVEELLHSNNLFPLATEQTTHPPFSNLEKCFELELN